MNLHKGLNESEVRDSDLHVDGLDGERHGQQLSSSDCCEVSSCRTLVAFMDCTISIHSDID